MTEKEIIKLAEKTRTAQKDYFATRSSADLTAAKSLEKQLDEMLEVITGKPVINERKSNQLTLF